MLLSAAIAAISSEKQIKLEDIERDNLLSERQSISGGPRGDPINPEQGQHTPGNSGASYEVKVPISCNKFPKINFVNFLYCQQQTSGEQGENDISEDILYAQRGSSGEDYNNEQVQYVTPQQYEQDNGSPSPGPEVYTRPVHEATRTYSAPARHSLNNPIIPKANPAPSPYLAQQPRFVYVQAGQQQLSPNGVITYSQPQHAPENIQQQPHAPDDISYASVEQNQILENSQQATHAPIARPSLTYGPRNLYQYVPLLAQTP